MRTNRLQKYGHHTGKVAEPVELNRVPAWLRQRLLRRYGPHEGRTRAWTLLYHCPDKPYLDHWGTICRDGQLLFVNEPYDDRTDGAEKFAAALGLKWWVEKESSWNPPMTIRFVFAPDGDLESAPRGESPMKRLRRMERAGTLTGAEWDRLVKARGYFLV